MPCAEQIHAAVLDMDSIFPKASFGSLVLWEVWESQMGLCLNWLTLVLPIGVMSWEPIPFCGWAILYTNTEQFKCTYRSNMTDIFMKAQSLESTIP